MEKYSNKLIMENYHINNPEIPVSLHLNNSKVEMHLKIDKAFINQGHLVTVYPKLSGVQDKCLFVYP